MHTSTSMATMCFKCFKCDRWSVSVVGSIPELGDWDPSRALPMQLEAELDGCREWVASIKCPVGQPFQFKFVANENGIPRLEAGENRTCCPSDPWMEVAEEFRGQEVDLRDPQEESVVRGEVSEPPTPARSGLGHGGVAGGMFAARAFGHARRCALTTLLNTMGPHTHLLPQTAGHLLKIPLGALLRLTMRLNGCPSGRAGLKGLRCDDALRGLLL